MAALTAIATAAQAGPYVGVNAGVAIFHDSDVEKGTVSGEFSYDFEPAVGVSAGFQWAGGLRAEAEVAYRKADVDTISAYGMSGDADGDLRVMSYMLNGYYDFPLQAAVRPFVGAGLGGLDGRISFPGAHESDTVFGYQAMAGVALTAAPHLTLDLSYRYQGLAAQFR
ncbi:MAG: porin family protein [Geobacter sp.]|nr:MAG: porin family protein [Geobacter sp.]